MGIESRQDWLKHQLNELNNRYEDLGQTISETCDVLVLPALGQKAGEVRKQIEEIRSQLNRIDQIRTPSRE